MATELTRIEEIYAAVLPDLAANNIEDTPLHRMWALQGLRDGWQEDNEVLPLEQSLEKSLYMLAISSEILVLQFRVGLQRYSNNT